MQRSVKIKQMLPYPIDQVWKAITDPNLLGKWFMENDFQPAMDREFTFRMAPQKGWDGITHCKVTELEPMKKIGYTYSGSASGEKTLACAGIHSEAADKAAKNLFTKLDTHLAIELEPTCGGTLLKLTHSGFRGFVQVIISFVFGKGWKKQIMVRLPKVLQEMAATK